jgi:hypothetical protein
MPETPNIHFEGPITLYDRPSIAMANLLKGNLDATTRAIFTPMSLSPEETQNIRQTFLKGMEDDPLIKTAVDVATNPFVIIGAIMALGPWGKVANPAQMAKLLSEGGKFVKGIQPMMRMLTSPLTLFRLISDKIMINDVGKRIGNPLDAVIRIAKQTRWFAGRGHHAIQRSEKLFHKAAGRALTSTEKGLTSLALEGLHHTPKWSPKGDILRAPLQSYYSHTLGTKVPVMPDLMRVMKKEGGQALMDHFARLRDAYKRYGKIILKDGSGRIRRQLEAKGVVFLAEDYGPRSIYKSGKMRTLEDYFRWSKEWTQRQYHTMMGHISQKGPHSPHSKARIGNALPQIDELNDIRDAIQKSQGVDIFGPGMYAKYQQIAPNQVFKIQGRLENLVKTIQHHGTDFAISSDGVIVGKDKAAVETVLKEISTYLGKNFTASTGKQAMQEGARTLTHELLVASRLPKEQMDDAIRGIAHAIGHPGEYMLDSSKVFRNYVDKMATSYGWWRHDTGPLLARTLSNNNPSLLINFKHKPSSQHEFEWIRKTFFDDLGPMLMGMKNYKEFSRASFWTHQAAKFREWLVSDSPVMRLLSEKQKGFLLSRFTPGAGSITDATLGGKISGLLYTSALGMNMSPVSKNILQPFITTMNLLGPRNMALGMKKVMPNIVKLPELAKKIGTDRAIRKLFPEFYKEFGGEGIASAMAHGDIAKEGVVAKAGGMFTKFKQGLMLPFAMSEKWNRLLTFYSAHEAALVSGVPKVGAGPTAANFATKINMLTQFTGGTLGMPQWARSAWAPFRQFGHFPSRMVEYLSSSAGLGPEGKFTLGPLGRGIAGSAGLYTIMKNIMKLDASQGLMIHALPGPVFEKSSFYPAPYVPPLVGAMGDVIKAFHSGDFKPLKATAALFVPGGLGARRAWRTFSPKYAKYGERTADGRIPVFNDKGALISTQSPMELALRGLGLRPTGPVAEQQMMQYLLQQRDQIRMYRRDYMEKLAANDLQGAREVDKAFRKKYPALGSLKTKKADLAALKSRKEMTRINRTLKGLPRDYRPLFQEMMESITLRKLAQDIDGNPDSLEYFLE